MSRCPRCDKPVYFAERKSSLGQDWHPTCLRCYACDRLLSPGGHSEHIGKPYCNNCYQQLFGPDGFRAGCVEPKKVRMNNDAQSEIEKEEILGKIREYNLYKEAPLEQLKYREVNNRILFEGVLKIYWGVKNAIILAPGAAYAKQRHNRQSIYDFVGVDDGAYLMMLEEASKARMRRELQEGEKKRLREIAENSVSLSNSVSFSGRESEEFTSLPPTSLSQDSYDFSVSLPASRPNLESSVSVEYGLSSQAEGRDEADGSGMSRSLDRKLLRDRDRSGSVIVRKRSASFRKISRQKRKEEAKDDSKLGKRVFTPPLNSSTNLRLSSTICTNDVVQMLLSKFKAENDPSLYGLFVVYDSGAQEPLLEKQCPLMVRLQLGPSEDISKLYIMEKSDARAAQISAEYTGVIMSDSPDLTGQQHGRPGRGAGAAAGAAAGAGRDHRGVGQDVRGLLAEKEHEIQKLNRLLEKAGEEVKKWKDHSKSQSKKIQELQSLPSQVTPEQRRSMSLLEEEISQLKEIVERLGYSLSTLEKEKLDLVNEVEVAKTTIKRQGYSLSTLEKEKLGLVNDVGVAKTTAAVYKEDFESERRERERAAAKIDLLEEQQKKIIESQQRKEAEQKRRIDLVLTTEAEQKQKVAKSFQNEIDEERKKLEKALEEVHVKASQVKQYKKQVDALQRDLKEAQEVAQHYKLLAKSQVSQDQDESHTWAVQNEEIRLTQQELGRGAWGVVIVAEFRGLQVAAKCLHSDIICDYNRDMFVREMNIAAKLRHPNLVQFIGATLKGRPVILTELMTTSLRATLVQGPLEPAQINSIGQDVARALNYMHLTRPDPILHRDISSANVLLNPTASNGWLAKLSDYGSANFLRKVKTIGPGNPSYSAPEAAIPSKQSIKMDVFSFGVMLVEMVIQKSPDQDIRAAQIHEAKMRCVDLPTLPGLAQLIQKCTDGNPARRPTIGNVLSQLK